MPEEIKKESKLSEYQKEAQFDLELDRITLEDKTMKLPGIKGKWVARLMNHKSSIVDLEKIRHTAIEQIADQIEKTATIGLSKNAAKMQALDHQLVKKIDGQIKEHQLVIEYLEKLEKVLSSMSFDCSNIINLIKMEQS